LEEAAMPSDLVIFAQLGIIVVLVLLFQLIFRMYAITYRLTDIGVQVVLLGVFPVSTTQYRLIREVRTISLGEALLYPFAAYWGTKPFPRSSVVIYRKYWFPMIVTPDDPEEFAREVRRCVYSANRPRS
jgi:hypothetical protein